MNVFVHFMPGYLVFQPVLLIETKIVTNHLNEKD